MKYEPRLKRKSGALFLLLMDGSPCPLYGEKGGSHQNSSGDNATDNIYDTGLLPNEFDRCTKTDWKFC